MESTKRAVLQNEMNDVPGMKISLTWCGCAEIQPAPMHNANDIQMSGRPNITSSNFKKNQMAEHPSVGCPHACIARHKGSAHGTPFHNSVFLH